MTSAREEVDEENDDIEPYPFGPARRLELHPRFAELRATKPVAEVRLPYGGRAWLLTRYADIKTAMNDPRFRRTTPEDPDVPRTTEDYPASRESLLTAPPQEHMRLRRLVMKAFTHREIEKLREQAQVIVDGLIDDMVERGSPADLGEAIAWQLPIRIICKILGGDVADKDRFAKWAVQVQGSQGREQMEQGHAELNAHLAQLVAARRAAPADDLLSSLVLARDEGDRLTEEELISTGMVLLVGGFETSANQICNSVYTLLERPELWNRLVESPEYVPNAVEELLRFLPLVQETTFPVVAGADIELSGVLIKEGDAVISFPYAGNRDPEVFDRPEEIDLTRSENPHLTFSHGVHHCLGAALARMEIQVVLDLLVRRLPRLRLAIPAEDVEWRSDLLLRTIRRLPVAW
ncbi:MAG: cytochrome P450 [Saccharopolyspora sp.]|uniref:cytochrome P450 n=1 Tax=unclassified Saccharopolyspora TaxID=2646250 RepID=UPI0025E416D1|nr:cytochrome P450 [Saccharopolyspora sp.]MBQ6641594.1 cytochrome P450 [Saccharopolyspora sp.]